jgi:hypothetical protein
VYSLEGREYHRSQLGEYVKEEKKKEGNVSHKKGGKRIDKMENGK